MTNWGLQNNGGLILGQIFRPHVKINVGFKLYILVWSADKKTTLKNINKSLFKRFPLKKFKSLTICY